MKSGLVIFFSIFLALYGLINYYIGFKFWQVLSRIAPFLNIKVYWGMFWIVALSYIIARALKSVLPDVVRNFLTVVGSYWMGIMLYSFLIFIIFDLVRLLDKWLVFIPQSVKNNPNTIQYIGIFFIAFIMVTIIYGAWNAKAISVVQYDVNISKEANNLKSLHIVALSDIHLGATVDERQIQKAANTINELNPDIVLFVGDTIDEDINVLKEKNMVSIFGQIHAKYGKYAVLGNHEYISGRVHETIKYIEDSGIKVLRDNYTKINDSFYLVGRDDKASERMGANSRKGLSEILMEVDKSLPIILLDHQPFNLNEAKESKVDLQLSGHTHKGQVFPGQIITNRIYENDWGLLKKDGLTVIVSSGFGTWGPPIRIGSKSEILDINVNFK